MCIGRSSLAANPYSPASRFSPSRRMLSIWLWCSRRSRMAEEITLCRPEFTPLAEALFEVRMMLPRSYRAGARANKAGLFPVAGPDAEFVHYERLDGDADPHAPV